MSDTSDMSDVLSDAGPSGGGHHSVLGGTSDNHDVPNIRFPNHLHLTIDSPRSAPPPHQARSPISPTQRSALQGFSFMHSSVLSPRSVSASAVGAPPPKNATRELIEKSRDAIKELQAELETERERTTRLTADLAASKKELSQERLNNSSNNHDTSLFKEKETRLYKELAIYKANETIYKKQVADLERHLLKKKEDYVLVTNKAKELAQRLNKTMAELEKHRVAGNDVGRIVEQLKDTEEFQEELETELKEKSETIVKQKSELIELVGVLTLCSQRGECTSLYTHVNMFKFVCF